MHEFIYRNLEDDPDINEEDIEIRFGWFISFTFSRSNHFLLGCLCLKCSFSLLMHFSV